MEQEKDHCVPCFNQIFRPKEMTFRKPGQGDCTVCTCDHKNRECSAYEPLQITIFTFDVKDK